MWISIIWSNLVLSCRLTKIIEKWCVNWNLQYIFLIVHLKALSGESQSLISPTMELTPAHFSHNIHVTFLSYCPKLLHCFFCFVLFSFCFFFLWVFFWREWNNLQANCQTSRFPTDNIWTQVPQIWKQFWLNLLQRAHHLQYIPGHLFIRVSVPEECSSKSVFFFFLLQKSAPEIRFICATLTSDMWMMDLMIH